MEPGAGKMAIGKLPARTDASANSIVMQKPSQRSRQVRSALSCSSSASRWSKPSARTPRVIEYCLQNELGADLKNPDTLAILKAMHDEDPAAASCSTTASSLLRAHAAQAWYEPWDDNSKKANSTAATKSPSAAGGINHQGAGDQWYDEFYKSPTDFTYTPLRNVLTEFGEMEGCATPDIHGLMVHQITETYKKYGGD